MNAQIHGIPPSVTSIPNHVPPYGVPNIPPSATSLGPYGYCCQGPSNVPYRNPAFPNRYNRRGNNGYGYGYGYGYTVPYYYAYPSDDASYYGGGGGPYLESGPPQGGAPPAEQTLHIIVDSAPQRPAPRDEDCRCATGAACGYHPRRQAGSADARWSSAMATSRK